MSTDRKALEDALDYARRSLQAMRVRAGRARDVDHLETIVTVLQAQLPAPAIPAEQRHGWVTPRADGFRARCGGPAMCPVCQAEQARA